MRRSRLSRPRTLAAAAFAAAGVVVVVSVLHGRAAAPGSPAGASGDARDAPTRSARHASPLPEAMSPGAVFAFSTSSGMWTPPPPLSLAFETDRGDALHSRGVNRITDVAEQEGTSWLGTHLGLKAVDQGRKQVRHYTRRDGLPGDYVEAVAADAGGVFALVRVGETPERLALCGFDAPSGQWRTLGEIRAPLPPSSEYGYGNASGGGAWSSRWGRGRIALTRDSVVAAPSAVDYRTDAVLHVWDRRKGTSALRPVAWDETLRADNGVLAFAFLWSDGKTIYAGTNVGLLAIDLSAGNTAAPVWRRLLPDSAIDAGAAEDGGKRLWLACHPRRPRGAPDVPGRPWQLVAFTPETGQVVRAGAPAAVGSPRALLMPRADRGADTYPRSVSFDPATGSVWVTWAAETRNGGAVGGFDRYDPRGNVWTALHLNGLTQAEEEAEARRRADGPPHLRPAPPGGIRPPTAERVPDAAVVPLALTLVTGPRARGIDSGGALDGNAAETRPPLWVRARFPEWYCPEDEAFSPGADSRARIFRPDPFAPGFFWTFRDGALVRVPASEVPTIRTGPDGSSGWSGRVDASGAERFPFGSDTRTVRPRVEALFRPRAAAQASAAGGLFVHTPGGLFLLDEAGRTWKPVLSADAQRGSFDGMNNRLACGGPDDSLYLRRVNDRSLLRFDPKQGTFVPSEVPDAPNARLIGGSRAGLYFADPVRRPDAAGFWFLPLGAGGKPAGKLERLEVRPPGASGLPTGGMEALGVTGDVAWFAWWSSAETGEVGRTRETTSLIGYDRVRASWTASRVLEPTQVNTSTGPWAIVPVVGADGATYFARDGAEASVLRYDPKRNTWSDAAPALPDPKRLDDQGWRAPLQLIAADGDALHLTDWRRLFVFDRKRRAWVGQEPLPEGVGDRDFSLSRYRRLMETKTALWVGTDNGLWRYDRGQRTWQSLTFPLRLDPSLSQATGTASGTATGVRLDIADFDRQAVWGRAWPTSGDQSFVFRFDRTTKQYALYGGPDSGLPGRGWGSWLKSDGETVWLQQEQGTYLLDRTAKRFRRVFAGRDDAPREKPPKDGATWGVVTAITPDPSDPDAVYLLLSDPVRTVYPKDPQPTLLYRYRKRAAQLEPMPMPPAFLAALGTPETDGLPYYRRPPGLRGTSGYSEGLLAEGTFLWVGTTLGLCRVDTRTGEWSLATLPPGTPYLAPARVYRDAGGALWLRNADSALRVAGTPAVVTTAAGRGQ